MPSNYGAESKNKLLAKIQLILLLKLSCKKRKIKDKQTKLGSGELVIWFKFEKSEAKFLEI